MGVLQAASVLPAPQTVVPRVHPPLRPASFVLPRWRLATPQYVLRWRATPRSNLTVLESVNRIQRAQSLLPPQSQAVRPTLPLATLTPTGPAPAIHLLCTVDRTSAPIGKTLAYRRSRPNHVSAPARYSSTTDSMPPRPSLQAHRASASCATPHPPPGCVATPNAPAIGSAEALKSVHQAAARAIAALSRCPRPSPQGDASSLIPARDCDDQK